MGLFGGNSNWRGPIWMPVNFLLVESLRRFHSYYGAGYTIEYPSGSGQKLTLNEVADQPHGMEATLAGVVLAATSSLTLAVPPRVLAHVGHISRAIVIPARSLPSPPRRVGCGLRCEMVPGPCWAESDHHYTGLCHDWLGTGAEGGLG